MEPTRARFESIVEWAVAAVFSLAIFAVGSLIVREFRVVSAVTPVIARETVPPRALPPAGVPSRAVSVPMLLLPGGKSVRIGESVSAVAARLGRESEVGIPTVERVLGGERLTRAYDHAGTRFVLVFERFQTAGEPRVAAIYLR